MAELLLISALIVACLALPANSSLGPLAIPLAGAALYEVDACNLENPDSTVTGQWRLSTASNPWTAVDNCPDGLVLNHFKAASSAQYASASMLAPAPVKALTLTLEGGDTTSGAIYEVFAGNPPGIATVPLPERHPGDPPETVTVDLPITSNVTVRARCAAEICPPVDSLKVRVDKFTLEDKTAPSLMGPWSGPGYGTIELDGWNKPSDLMMRFYASDSHSGTRTASINVSGGFTWSITNNCLAGPPWPVAMGCPRGTPEFYGSIFTAGLAEGPHNITIQARDAVNNTWLPAKVHQFSLDSVAPARPVDFAVSGVNQHGWTADSFHDIGWTTVGEGDPSDTESGLDHPEYEVVAAGGAEPVFAPARSSINGIDELSLPGDGRWELFVSMVDKAGNTGPPRAVAINRDIDAPEPPALHPLGWLNRQQLSHGVIQSWDPPVNMLHLESGICGHAVTFGSVAVPGAEPNLNGFATMALVPADLPEGTTPVRVRAVSCAGLASGIGDGEIQVDSLPPVLAVSGLPADGWAGTPVTATIAAHDANSGVAALRYVIDGEPEVQTPEAHAEVTLGDGVHTLQANAVDVAGNRSANISATVKIDSTPPLSWLAPPDPTDPTTIEGTALDAASGVAEAHLELSRVDGGASAAERSWRQIGQPTENGLPGQTVAVTARLADESLPDGAYEIRLVTSDRAGNHGVGLTTESSGTLRVTLPVRERPSITAALAAIVKRCKAGTSRRRGDCKLESVIDRRDVRARRLVHFGQRTALVGVLRHADGRPIAGAPVKVFAQHKFGARVFAGDATTDAGGRYSFAEAGGVSRTLTARFVGDKTAQSATATANIGVPGAASLRISPRRQRVGRTIQISGRLKSGGAGLPTAGKLVPIQFLSGRVWRPAVALLRTDLKGRFRASYELTQPVERPITIRFRVMLPREDNWPYEDGFSATRSVTVTP